MSENGEWVPFGLTEEETESYQVLVDGVPNWMREPLVQWLASRMADVRSGTNTAGMVRVQNGARVDLGFQAGDAAVGTGTLAARLRQLHADHLLRLTDYLLSEVTGPGRMNSSNVRVLESSVLLPSKSKWTIGVRMGDRLGLVERVPEGVQISVEATIESSGAAGRVLARAWAKVHGLTADDSGAYVDAVKAVEIAGQPIVEPRNTEATLGSILAVMEGQGDWQLPLRDHVKAPTGQVIVAMCRTLWRGHSDRHGREDYADVTHEEARAAVVLAATMVDWFTSGAIQRRPETD